MKTKRHFSVLETTVNQQTLYTARCGYASTERKEFFVSYQSYDLADILPCCQTPEKEKQENENKNY